MDIVLKQAMKKAQSDLNKMAVKKASDEHPEELSLEQTH